MCTSHCIARMLEQMFTLLGDAPATAATKAAGVLRIETALAKIALPYDEILYGVSD